MKKGWVAIHRQLLENPMANKPDYMNLWIHLLLMANHKETTFIWNGKKQILKPGQLLTGRKKLSKKTGISPSKTYRILKYLENEQQIEQQKTNKYTVITIVNWDRYQKSGQENEQQMNNKWTHTTMYNNVNKQKGDFFDTSWKERGLEQTTRLLKKNK